MLPSCSLIFEASRPAGQGKRVIPFLKWAGGKRWLFTAKFVESLPKFNRYIEPFLGGGAAFFALRPHSSVLSDINPDLINLYSVIKHYPKELKGLLEAHQKKHSKLYYYDTRSEKPQDPLGRAAWFLYLNRTCWNGLYRLNRDGIFNVPIGDKIAVVLPTDDFIKTSKLLANADLQCRDFAHSINQATDGDLIFVDPPYTVKHNTNGFVKYNENIFKWEDQIRLRDCLRAASTRGASILVSNADHPSVRQLYDGFGMLESVERASVISGTTRGRSNVSELLVRA